MPANSSYSDAVSNLLTPHRDATNAIKPLEPITGDEATNQNMDKPLDTLTQREMHVLAMAWGYMENPKVGLAFWVEMDIGQ